MTNKQQKFNSIFTDSNISEIIWYYKFYENTCYACKCYVEVNKDNYYYDEDCEKRYNCCHLHASSADEDDSEEETEEQIAIRWRNEYLDIAKCTTARHIA